MAGAKQQSAQHRRMVHHCCTNGLDDEERGPRRIMEDVVEELVKLPRFIYPTPIYDKILLGWIEACDECR